MEKYELTVVLPPKTTEAKKNSVMADIEKVFKTLKAKIIGTKDWGEIELAYKVKGNTTGKFLFIELELEKAGLKDLSDKLKMKTEIIRYLIVKSKKVKG